MEISAQSQDETEIQGSWIPNTPYKPILPEQPPIYPERQEHQPEQGNWLESEECPPGFPPETQNNKRAACLTSTYCPHNWKNGTATDNIGTCREFSTDVLSGLDNVRFGDLLALADAASVASVVGSDSTAKGPCFSNSYSQIDGSRMESSSVAFPYMKPDFSLRSNIWTASNGPLENSQDKLSNPQQHSYDLNFPPETMFNKMPQKMILDFAPITPEKVMRVEGNQLSETQYIFTEEGTNWETDKQRNEAAATNHTFEGLHSNKELPEPAGHSSLVAASTASKENHNPDKGHTQDVELNKTPQQKPKRKKHRPKVITEGKPRRTQKPTMPKPAASEKNPTGKRKYVRKKRVDKDSTPLPAVVSGESSDLKTLEQTKKSTRRALHFDTAEPGDENSACKSTLNLHTEPQAQDCCDKESQSTSTMQLIDIEVMIEDRQVGIADEFSLTVNPTLKEYIFLPEGQAPSTPLPTKTNPPRRRKRDANFQGNNKAGQVAAHNIEDNCLQIMLPTETQTLPGSPTDKGSTSTILTEEGQVRRSKRKYSRSTGQEHTSSTNVIGIQYNILQAYQTMSWIQFPKVNRKKRTEKGQCSTKASAASITAEKNIVGQEITCSHSDAKADPFASKANYWISTPPNASGMPAPLGAAGRDGAEDKLQTFECVTGFNQREGSTKKGSRGTTQVRDLASLSGIADCNIYSTYPGAQVPVPGCNRPAFENSHGPHTSMEAIVAEMQATLARKKRTKKRNSHMSRELSSEKAMQIHPKIILHDHHQFFAPSSVAAPDALWKQEFSVDAISEQLKLLDINRETNHIPYCEQNALIPYIMGDQEQNALVLYRRDGAVVPFEGPFYPLKKRRSRPKVDLDDETNRVWKLLMGNINSEGIDGTDEEKAKWWEEERRVFHGRVDSFIARMHLVQGDRRFSPWKGSVVDSVVGVFLTQNVSDHLSSSAFMSLAARFPLKSNSNDKSCHEEGASSVTHEPVVYLVDLEDTMSDQPVCNQTSMTLQDTSHNEEKEVFNSDETSRSSGGIGSLTKESTCQLFDPGSGYSEVNRSTTEITGTRTVISVGHRRAKIDTILSQDSVLSPQNSLDLTTAQTAERTGSCSESNSEGEDLINGPKQNSLNGSTSFMELLQMQGSTILQNFYSHENSNVYSDGNSKDEYIHAIEHDTQINNIDDPSGPKSCVGPPITSASYNSSDCASDPGVLQVESFEMFKGVSRSNVSRNKEEYSRTEKGPLRAKSMSQITEQDNLTVRVQQATRSAGGNNQSRNSFQEDEDVIAQSQTTMLGDSGTIIESEDQVENRETDQLTIFSNHSGGIPDVIESTSALDNQITTQQKTHQSDLDEQSCSISKEHNELNTAALRSKGRKVPKEKKDHFDWDSFTRQVEYTGSKTERTANAMDSVDWEAVRSAEVNEISQTIKERGMNNMLAERIKDFLDRLVREHGSIDLEWLRDIPPDKAKEYLLSIRGLGLKSVECVRLLTLHHLAFPVDTNVGRIAVRLGWVPLQPLPESLQLHLLELYPILESIQKYLWPRLCKLDQRTLYELHYQMITFGKVFCTKSKPNCNACPMRGECRHFASAFASARLALPGPEERSIMSRNDNREPEQSPAIFIEQTPLPLLEATEQLEGQKNPETKRQSEAKPVVSHCEPVIEEPATPEPECAQALENEMEDTFCEDPDEIPTIKLNMEEFTQNLQNYMQENMELQEGDMSKALVALTAEAASIPMPKLKNVSRLRTEHQVYELPDSHPLLKGLDKREPDDPCSYLLAIWTPGETANSIQPPEGRCSSQEHGKLCDENTCFSCNSIREAESHIVRGTLLIPCRTAMRGSFPLNGTYFQVNEVFADHDSSLNPINVPREWIWNLPRRTVYFGTSIPTIFKGLTTEGIQHCFWRGFVCVRGFDHKTRAPRPLIARLHFPSSKLGRTKGKMEGDDK